jgi:hypothetical protein
VSSNEWFVGRNGQRLGPYRFEALRQLAERNKLQPDDLVWSEGMPDWRRADAIKELPIRAQPESQSQDAAPDNSTAESVAEDTTTRAPRSNYFVRHWRGDLSLPVSYWINGGLVTFLLALVFTAIGESGFVEQLGARRVGWWIVGVLVSSIGCVIWQSVGIWRSAGKHASRGGSSGWATAARVLVVLGLLRLAGFCAQEVPMLQQGFQLVLGTDRTPPSQLHILNHGTEVEVAGGMSFGTTEALKTILDATPTINTVQLNNIGGFIAEGERIGQLISARGLSTFTARECVSACLLAFMGGNKRYLGSKGRLGFHEASVAGVGGEVAKEGTERFRRVLLERGVPSAFVDRALTTAPSGMWYPTIDELLSAHIITSVVDERDYAMTGVSDWRDRSKLEADFAKTPLFAALKRAEPAAYENLKEIYISGVQGGVSQAEMATQVHSVLIDKVLPKYLRSGPDLELIAYWRSELAEMRELRAVDPRYCVAFIFPSKDIDFTQLSRHISGEMLALDLNNLTQLLDATSLNPATAPPEAAVQSELKGAAVRTEQHSPGALRVVANPEKSAGNPKKLCDAELAFFEEIISLPPNQAGPTLRYLAASS